MIDDQELQKLLREWDGPDRVPARLDRAVLDAVRKSPRDLRWWQWIWSGSIRVPVPVAVAMIALAVIAAVMFAPGSPRPPQRQEQEFEAVKEWKPRIVRSSYYAQQ